ncbi:MAG: hypothetical protein JW940_18930 [Polyangiaceae bacterium]|nr:hypothetical protein [Polyangiaceae bacterium]
MLDRVNVGVLAATVALPVAIVFAGCGGGGSGRTQTEAGAAGAAGTLAAGAQAGVGGAQPGNGQSAGAPPVAAGTAGAPAGAGAGGLLAGGGSSGVTATGGVPGEAGAAAASAGEATGGNAAAGAPGTGGVAAAGAGGTSVASGGATGGSSAAAAAGEAGEAGGAGGVPSVAGAAGSAGTEEDPCPPVAESVSSVAGVEVSTPTGSSARGFRDGSLSQARFSNPVNVAADGDLLYVADFDNGAIRVVDMNAETVNTLYETPDYSFCRPFGLALASAETLFVGTDCGPNTTGDIPLHADGTIWRLDTQGGSPPEPVLEAGGRPRGLLHVAPDSNHPEGQLVYSDLTGAIVQVLDLDSGAVRLLGGLSGYPGFADGGGSAARFNRPYGMALLDGDVIVADNANHALRRVTLDGVVTTFAGTGCPGLVDGPLAQAMFNAPQDVAADAQGNLFVTDGGNGRIRVIHDGTVSTLAGGPEKTWVDGTGAEARFFGQEGLDVSPDGASVYVADGNGGEPDPYNRIRLLTVPPLD